MTKKHLCHFLKFQDRTPVLTRCSPKIRATAGGNPNSDGFGRLCIQFQKGLFNSYAKNVRGNYEVKCFSLVLFFQLERGKIHRVYFRLYINFY
jgi:hypothetical protein